MPVGLHLQYAPSHHNLVGDPTFSFRFRERAECRPGLHGTGASPSGFEIRTRSGSDALSSQSWSARSSLELRRECRAELHLHRRSRVRIPVPLRWGSSIGRATKRFANSLSPRIDQTLCGECRTELHLSNAPFRPFPCRRPLFLHFLNLRGECRWNHIIPDRGRGFESHRLQIDGAVAQR